MSTVHPDQDFIVERHTLIRDAWNKHSVEEISSFYADSGLDFSDYGVGQLHLDKPGLYTYVTNMMKGSRNLKVDTVSISGTKHFTTWEWNLSLNHLGVVEEAEGEKKSAAEVVDGRELKLIGVSVSWWNEDGKIVKNNDYAKIVQSFDER